MFAEPQKEHAWLQRLVGKWASEMECVGPDGKTMKSKGTETVRSLGGLWTLGEGVGEMPDGAPATSLMTLGFDPQKGRFVGTFVASMMTYLWTYDGKLDGNKLILDAEGPVMTGEGKMGKYQDIIEMRSDDHRVMTSQLLGDDGKWTQFMEAHYRRA
jgi:hypothetical protein